jgi:hypothetical protein
MKLRWLLLIVLGACAPSAWQVRTLPPCYQPLAEVTQERERAELAAVLALENRGYAVTRREGWVEAAGAVHWKVRVTDTGGLDIDSPGARDTAATRARFGELQQAIAKIRCGELETLRAEAQARHSAGGEDVAARLIELHEERARTRPGPKIAWAATGAVIALTGISLGSQALVWWGAGCEEDAYYGEPDCSLRDVARPVGIAAVSMVVVGGTIVGIALPRMIETFRQRSELNREIKRLQLTIGAGSVGLRGSF